MLERVTQHLYPMELMCLIYEAPKKVVLDPNAQDFSPKLLI